MRILYLSQYFHPEVGATQTRAYEMAHNWVHLGHSVIMLTEFPNHPSGVIPKSYRGKLFEIDIYDGIKVIRVLVKASSKKNFINRILFYLSYMVNAILAGIFIIRGNFDFIFATSPPLFVGGAALVLSYIKHIPLIFEVRDLWPESAVALGELSNKSVIRWATKLEEACYRHATRIVVVTKGIYDHLRNRNIPEKKLLFIPNGANTDLFFDKPDERIRIRSELSLEDKFIAIYAGIFGLAQGLESVIDAARLLEGNNKIQFLMIGDGPKKKEIIDLVKKYQLNNVLLLPEQPRSNIPGYLSAADVALVPLKNAQIFKGALPSKIFDAWACKKPVLISIDGEARQIVENIDGGIFVPPEDPLAMANELTALATSPEVLNSMGENGYRFTLNNHSRKALADKLIFELEKITQSPGN